MLSQRSHRLFSFLLILFSISCTEAVISMILSSRSFICSSACYLAIDFFHSGFPGSSAGKESTSNARDPGSVPGLGRSPGEGIGYTLQYSWSSLVAQMVKNLPAMKPGSNPWVGRIRSPGWGHGNPLQYFAWRTPGTEEPAWLQSMGSQRVRQDSAAEHSVLFILVCSFFFEVFSKYFLYLLQCFSEILDYLHYHYSEFFFFFLEGCLSPLHLVIFIRFYLVPSSET